MRPASNAPIAFFAYRRPELTLAALGSLSRSALAAESGLFIFCDGAKGPPDEEGVAEVRRAVRREKWCGSVEIIEGKGNKGLSKSIIDGVTALCDKYGRVIVMEDDLIVSPRFLEYMNGALRRYESDERVMQISAYFFPVEVSSGQDAFFLPFTTSWGWATWARAWKDFDARMEGFETLSNDPAMRKRFDLGGAHPYFNMLKAQKDGSIDSWAIRWYLSVFLKDGLVLFPRASLVENVGFGGGGTHTTALDGRFASGLKDFEVKGFPAEIEASAEALEACKRFLRDTKGGAVAAVKERLHGFFKRHT